MPRWLSCCECNQREAVKVLKEDVCLAPPPELPPVPMTLSLIAHIWFVKWSLISKSAAPGSQSEPSFEIFYASFLRRKITTESMCLIQSPMRSMTWIAFGLVPVCKKGYAVLMVPSGRPKTNSLKVHLLETFALSNKEQMSRSNRSAKETELTEAAALCWSSFCSSDLF